MTRRAPEDKPVPVGYDEDGKPLFSRGQKMDFYSKSGRMREYKVLNGLIPPEDLTDEEVITGTIANDNGKMPPIRGRKVPRVLYMERQRRLFEDGDRLLQQHYMGAVSAIAEIAIDPNNAAADRIKAASLILDRVRGKVPDRVHVAAEDPVEKLFSRLIKNPDVITIPGEAEEAG